MTVSAIGEIVATASLVAAIACLLWAGLRAFRVTKRATNLAHRPAVIAFTGAAASFERIGASLGSLDGIGARIEAVLRDLEEASVASGHLVADVVAVAAATEGLLDATVPSMRGAFSDPEPPAGESGVSR
jgi:hypothetical protein